MWSNSSISSVSNLMKSPRNCPVHTERMHPYSQAGKSGFLESSRPKRFQDAMCWCATTPPQCWPGNAVEYVWSHFFLDIQFTGKKWWHHGSDNKLPNTRYEWFQLLGTREGDDWSQKTKQSMKIDLDSLEAEFSGRPLRESQSAFKNRLLWVENYHPLQFVHPSTSESMVLPRCSPWHSTRPIALNLMSHKWLGGSAWTYLFVCQFSRTSTVNWLVCSLGDFVREIVLMTLKSCLLFFSFFFFCHQCSLEEVSPED
jgi:hypothetical protein